MGTHENASNEKAAKFPSSPPPSLNQETVREILIAAFDKVRNDVPNAKVWQGMCADYCGVTTRSVQSWAYGSSIPHGVEMMRLILWLGEYSEALRGLIGEPRLWMQGPDGTLQPINGTSE